MKIAQVIGSKADGGAETFFMKLAQALHKHQVKQCFAIKPTFPYRHDLKTLNMPMIQLPFGGKMDIWTGMQLRKWIKREKPDIVFTWMSRATDKTPKIPNIPLVSRLGGYYHAKYYQHVDKLIGNTPDLADYLKQSFAGHKVHYIPNFAQNPIPGPRDRTLFDADPSKFILLAMGRFHENKAFDTLLKAIAPLKTVHLWLLGEGSKKSEYEKLIAQNHLQHRVSMPGWVNDASLLLRSCDAVVVPSRHEPLGNVVLEAWSYQKPLIAARSQGPSFLIQDEINGMLFGIDQVHELTETIKKLQDHKPLQDTLAQKGYETYMTHFSEETVVKHYLDFFKEVQKT